MEHKIKRIHLVFLNNDTNVLGCSIDWYSLYHKKNRSGVNNSLSFLFVWSFWFVCGVVCCFFLGGVFVCLKKAHGQCISSQSTKCQ